MVDGPKAMKPLIEAFAKQVCLSLACSATPADMQE